MEELKDDIDEEFMDIVLDIEFRMVNLSDHKLTNY